MTPPHTENLRTPPTPNPPAGAEKARQRLRAAVRRMAHELEERAANAHVAPGTDHAAKWVLSKQDIDGKDEVR